MATSEVGIVNIALARIGEQPLSSLTDDNEAGRLANRHYASLRDAVLRERQWNCAVRRAVLPSLATAPSFGFSACFSLPSDFIRLISLEDIGQDFAIENTSDGRVICADDFLYCHVRVRLDELRERALVKLQLAVGEGLEA